MICLFIGKPKRNKNLVRKYLLMTTNCKFVLFSIIINITFFWKCLLNVLTFLGWGCWKCMLMYINNNKPFIDLKCTYYTKTTALWKFNYGSDEIFTTEIDIAHYYKYYKYNTWNTIIIWGKKEDVVFSFS